MFSHFFVMVFFPVLRKMIMACTKSCNWAAFFMPIMRNAVKMEMTHALKM